MPSPESLDQTPREPRIPSVSVVPGIYRQEPKREIPESKPAITVTHRGPVEFIPNNYVPEATPVRAITAQRVGELPEKYPEHLQH